ncbi:DUF3017 domain-containing protein [Streptomyces sp. NBC_00133]|uniref:DUF3017 domain-containing protein n=1 Tax=Streptomyces sp. NBC_00133 TaxID=2903624 RepID=UPI003244408B
MGVSRNDEGAARPAPTAGAAGTTSGADGGMTTPGDPVGGAAPAGGGLKPAAPVGGAVPAPEAPERAADPAGPDAALVGGSGPLPDAADPEVGDAVEAALAEAVHPRSPTVGTDVPTAVVGRSAKVDMGDQASFDSEAGSPNGSAPRVDVGLSKAPSRRPPALTRDTARPEGGGRAAPGDASAPARQWPLLTVLGLAGLGLVIVASDGFADAFRIGTILIGVALITGAVMRRVLPSVGMLAVRSRFTDMVTYGLLGTLIVLLALVTQPKPWLDVPFLEDAVHFTVR